MSGKDIILVTMPWHSLNRTPIQMGILKPTVERAGFSVGTRSYFVDAMNCFQARTADAFTSERVTIMEYQRIAHDFWDVGLGDWIFAVPPYKSLSEASDNQYFSYLRFENVPEEMISAAVKIRNLIPEFLASCVDDILLDQPKAVGFSVTFSQNVASLVLAKMLKVRNPSLHIIFGGANCDGPMGDALHRSFCWVDTVVRGEGDIILPEILSDIIGGVPIRPQPGLCYRKESERMVIDQSGMKTVLLDETPVPDYDEYFMRLRSSPLAPKIGHKVVILFESARGCWWGQKKHCAFCGLNGSSMVFRSKKAERIVHEIYRQASRYRRTDFEAVDNIMDMNYMDDLLPTLRDSRRSGIDFSFFYETKSNLKKVGDSVEDSSIVEHSLRLSG